MQNPVIIWTHGIRNISNALYPLFETQVPTYLPVHLLYDKLQYKYITTPTYTCNTSYIYTRKD